MNDARPARQVLFVTWEGPETNYLETLFNPLFEGLVDYGFRFHTLQFTWADKGRIERIRKASTDRGIGYRAHRVLRSPVSTGALATAIWGRFAVRSEIRRNGIDIIMPRSTLPALSSMLACPERRGRTPAFLLDADGLPHDERVEFGGWSSSGPAYRLLRDLEAQSVRRADKVLVRSDFAADVLMARAGPGTAAEKFRTVTNGRDPSLFKIASASGRDAVRRRLGVPADAPLIVYAGTIAEQYHPKEMRIFFEDLSALRADAHLLILTGNLDAANDYFQSGTDAGLEKRTRILTAAPDQVPELLGASDLALSLRVPGFSMRAVFPVKTGEYLLSGLPVITNKGIGDLDRMVPGSEACFVLDEVTREGIARASRWASERVLPDIDNMRPIARKLGVELFSVERTIEGYAAALRECHETRMVD